MTEGVEGAEGVDVGVAREVGAVDHAAGERADRGDAGVQEGDVGAAGVDGVRADGGAQAAERGAGGGGHDVGGAAQVVGAVEVDRADAPGTAQRAHRAARDPGGEPTDKRDLTHDTPP